MAMSIRTNVSSLNAQRALFNAGNDLNKSMQRLSSGFRINSSADDAAGLAISTKMQSQIGGLNQAAMNAQDGISMIQSGEGALDEITSSLQRMRDLAVQGANATLSDTDRGTINTEVQALLTNINNIAAHTQFNGQSLLTGALSTAQNTATSTVLTGMNLTTNDTASITSIDVSKATAATTYTLTTSGAGIQMAATINGVATTQTIAVNVLAAGQSQTFDFSSFGVKFTTAATGATTVAGTQADLTTKTIATGAGSGAAAFQVGANANETESATFFNAQVNALNTSGAGEYSNLAAALTTFGGATTVANASSLITNVDAVIGKLVSSRAVLGAAQNSLQHTMNNVKVMSDNLSASNSRIRDVDVAAESSAMTRAQIISQSAVSVLAQANQMPQLALKLLG
jgi:flagellin